MAKENKQKSKTVSTYHKWQATKVGLYVGKYLAPCVPATVITAVNWDEWFVKSGASLPFGFATLLISVIVTILAITKGDDLVSKNVSKIYYIAGVMAVWSISFMFLANILQQMGQMLLWTIAGIVTAGTCDQVNMSLVNSRINEYKTLIEENCLNSSARKRAERKARAEAEAKAEAEAQQATE